jgi:hypothetical protein
LYGTPNAGNLATNPTPIRLLLQDTTIDFKGDLKKLYAQSQFPISSARGKIDVTGKTKIVSFEPDPINQLFWGQTAAAGMILPVDQELHVVPNTSPFSITVTNGATFDQDKGVSYSSGPNAGQLLLAVTAAPSVSVTYQVSNAANGTYLFNSTDNGVSVLISYTYSNSTRGKTITLTNQLMGYAPVVAMDLWNTFRNKVYGIRLNACTLGGWSIPTKLEDYWMADVSFECNVDASNTLGRIYADTF